MSFLRQISFGMDFHWCRKGAQHEQEDQTIKKPKSEYVELTERPLSLQFYSFFLYLAYLYYPPLYLAGPICSFNAFVNQVIL